MMDEHIKNIDRKFYRAFYKILVEKPFLNYYRTVLLNYLNESVESDYMATKFKSINSRKVSPADKLKQISKIYNFDDKKLFESILNKRINFLIKVVSLTNNQSDFIFLFGKGPKYKRGKNWFIKQSGDRERFIKEIIKVKKDLENRNQIITKRKVANKMGLTEATFRDKLFHYKIMFNNPR